MPNYSRAVSNTLKFAGIDQGIDFTGKGSVFALGPGRVTRLVKYGSGWPGDGALLVYQITGGPAKGRYVYVAEDLAFAKGLKVGSTFKAGQVIAYATGSGHAPGIEMGWANAAGHALANLHPNPHSPKPEGRDFHQFVVGLPFGQGSTSDSGGYGGDNSGVPTQLGVSSSPPGLGYTGAPDNLGGPATYTQAQAYDPGTYHAEGLSLQQNVQNWQAIAADPAQAQSAQMFLQNAQLANGG